MKKHIFEYLGEGIYKIKCKSTGGDFSTEMWRLEKHKQGFCPCCGEKINEQ